MKMYDVKPNAPVKQTTDEQAMLAKNAAPDNAALPGEREGKVKVAKT